MLLILKKNHGSFEKPFKNNKICEGTYGELKPPGSKLWAPVGSAKVHKPLKIGFPLFKPIISAIGTPTYKLPNI